MAIKISKFDAAEHLHDEKDVAEYMAAVMETGDPKHIAKAVGTVARARGMADIAKESGLSRESLYRAFSENGNPTISTLLAVLKSLNVTLSATLASAAVGASVTPRKAAAKKKAKPKRKVAAKKVAARKKAAAKKSPPHKLARA